MSTDQSGAEPKPRAESRPESQPCSPVIPVACLALIVLGAGPILLKLPPMPTADFFEQHPGLQVLGRIFLAGLILGGVWMIARLDSARGAEKRWRYLGFVLLAALLTDIHFYTVEIDRVRLDWQMKQYVDVLKHTGQPPDQYRFMPHGTVWWLLLCNGDLVFSMLAYRFFFTFLVCQAAYTFARLFLSERDAILVVLGYAVFYPLSTRYYYGNWLDPMSHAVMLAALTYCRRGRFGCVFWLFTLGAFIKETMLVIAPCYWLMNFETQRGREARVWGRVGLLLAVGVAVFFVCRLPFQFDFDFKTLNRTSGLMIYSNLGLPGGRAWSSVSVFQRYLHPILFFFMWLPLLAWRRKLLPRSLFWTTLYLAAALYFTNLCFSWNYESRNFIPALILLLVGTVMVVNKVTADSKTAEAEASRL